MIAIFKKTRPAFLTKLVVAALTVIALAWIGYYLLGLRLIEVAYNSTSLPLVDLVMSRRNVTPLSQYYEVANTLMLHLTGQMLILLFCCAFVVLTIRGPRRVAVMFVTIVASSLLLFSLLEIYPNLIRSLNLDKTLYYSMSLYKIPDSEMGFRGRPLLDLEYSRGGDMSYVKHGLEPLSGIIEWKSDRDGFRESKNRGTADIVVIGDSYISHGWTERDTFVGRLERHLGSQKVANVAVAGWGPHQYLQALKRYGVAKRPKIALFSFYGGNDFWQITDYLQWKSDGTQLYAYSIDSKPFPERFLLAMSGIIQYIRKSVWAMSLSFVHAITLGSDYVDPDVAVVSLNGQIHKMRFVDHHMPMTTAQIVATEEWRELKKTLAEFKNVSTAHRIKPYLLYIPMGISIYAEYSTKKSGHFWLRIREIQIARKGNLESAIEELAGKIGIELLNLSVPFSIAAQKRQMLYEPIDDHWNSEGREVAAQYVANRLRKEEVRGK